MLLSFAVYTGLALILSFLGWHISQRENRLIKCGGEELPFYSWEIVISIILFAVVAGARYKTGYDYIDYLSQYIQLRDFGGFSRHDYEVGFVFISKAFAAIKVHEFFYFAFWAALQLGLFYYAFRKNKSLLPWLALLIMLGGYFVGWMNTIRQVVVECAFVALIPMCTSWRKTLLACLISLLFATIHITAIFIAVYLPIMYATSTRELPRKYSLAIFVIFIALGVYPFWFKWIGADLISLFEVLNHKYVHIIERLLDGGFRICSWGPTHIMLVLSQALVLWFYPTVKEDNEDDKILKHYYFLSFWGMCLSNLLINTKNDFLRPVEYLSLCTVVMMAYTMRTLYRKKLYIALSLLCICTFSTIYIAVMKATYMPTDVNVPFLYNILFLR
ncbi:MAG: EpsG family protein [Bacteroidales bacterium]|nr:EpsG family protein [Candidatus Sodaliphilus fimicaballi]